MPRQLAPSRRRRFLSLALRRLGRGIFRLAYRVEVRGLDKLAAAGNRGLIVVNHVSFLDGPLIGAFLPGNPLFAIDPEQLRHWWARPFLAAVETYSLDPLRPLGIRSLIEAVEAGRQCVIFPEGRINVTGGALMKIYEGSAMIADHTHAIVVPVRLDGPELTPFSRLGDRLRRRLFPRILITIYEPRPLAVPQSLRGRARRHRAGTALYDLMSEMMASRAHAPSLYAALLAARRTHGGRRSIIEDALPSELSYRGVVLASETLGRRLARATKKGETVGLLLPNSVGTAVVFLALQAFGRVPAMLNPTAGPDGVAAAARTAGLRLVLTSRRFVEAARLDAVAGRLADEVELLWLEDVRREIGLGAKLAGLFAALFAETRHRRLAIEAGDSAVVLFTSGSEGAPKGVVLSHANLLANQRQIAARVDFSPRDFALNALPMFHAFGLTGFLLPLLSGVPCHLYPSPLHYRMVPEIAYGTNTTIVFGTDTFLSGYARRADPYDFFALRYVFAGGESVREQTRALWFERFGVRVLEGYGVTECAPVIACNTPMHYRTGTVGRLLPLVEHRIESVAGIEEGGRLVVRGPNVMLGYLHAERAQSIEPPLAGWYDTGDIVAIDDEGYVRIIGRAKRFAKVGGETVSLALSEAIAEAAYPETRHAVVALADVRRGETLVLVSEARGLERGRLVAAAQRLGLADLAVPRELVEIDRLPLLGTGKPDYPAVARIAAQARDSRENAAAQQQPDRSTIGEP
jgi:acyl-[acyl-carrier-protein]-phospholipid O-acyltransferase/long-chain-fatty-acid--[acyl-carrier-protein] ligase